TIYNSYATHSACMTVLLSVFFYCYSTLLDLHSFPTRRSSDLNRHFRCVRRMPPLGRSSLAFEGDAFAGDKDGAGRGDLELLGIADRKSTRLNSSHDQISYAVFCLKKKKVRYVILYQALIYIDH